MIHKNTKNNGCLWLFIFSLVCITATVVISVFFQLKTTVSFVIAAILATIFTIIVYGKPSVSNLFRNVVVVFILVMGIRFALLSFFDLVKSTATETTFKIEEGVEGLIHNSELGWTNRNVKPNKILSVSQKIKFCKLYML